jgi:hypothetical protein
MSRHDPITRVPRPRRAVWMVRLLVLLSALCLAGTAFAREKDKEEDKGGDKLSDAAKQSAKPASEQRVVHADDHEKHHDNGGSCLAAVSFSSCDPCRHNESRGRPRLLEKIHVSTMVAFSSPASADLAPSGLFGIRAGIGDSRTSLDLALLGGASGFVPGSDMAALLRRPAEVAAEITIRHALTPDEAPIAISPILGFRAGVLTWDYLNPILVERDGEVRPVGSDNIGQYSPLVGVGLTVLRARHLEIGGALLEGWRFYDDHSDAGLRNDLFHETRFTELRLETRYTF